MLFHRYNRFMLDHVRKYIFETEAAEDLVQDVWENITLGLRSGQYEEQQIFSHWLYRVAHFTVTHEIEKRIRQKKEPLTEDMPADEENVNPDEQTWHAALQKALLLMSPQYAEILRLHYLEEMSYDEIGKKLGITTNAATSSCSKAKRRLREILEAMGMQW